MKPDFFNMDFNYETTSWDKGGQQGRFALLNRHYNTVECTNDDPRKLIETLIYDFDFMGASTLEGLYITDEKPGHFGQVIVLNPGEEMAAAVKAASEIAKRKREGKPKYEVIYSEGFLGAPSDMTSAEFREWRKSEREAEEAKKQESPIRAKLIDAAWAVWRFWRDTANPKDVYYTLKHACQRLRRGYSDRDTWGADHHILNVILGSLRSLREWRTGVPHKAIEDFTADDWKLYLTKDEYPNWTEEEWWDGVVVDIINAFERYRMVHQDDGSYDLQRHLTNDELAWCEQEFRKAGEVFFRYFGTWWD